MTLRRSYGQFCSLALALDLVGDRWTLLIVRELFAGPKRFSDLERGLPGIGSALLTERLTHLLAHELVARHPLPSPAHSLVVYELTARARSLDPVLTELAKWGTPRLAAPSRALESRPRWLLQALAAAAPRLDTAPDEAVDMVVDGEQLSVVARGGRLTAHDGFAEHATAVLAATYRALYDLASGHATEALGPGGLTVSGDPAAAGRLLRRLAEPPLLLPVPAAARTT